jgi:ATP-binding cassette, subfamily B, bacterial
LLWVQRYAAAVREDADVGRITILVSHRFSAVRMADLIVVLDGERASWRLERTRRLLRYVDNTQLYSIQAAAYR